MSTATLFSNIFKSGRIKGYRAGDVELRDWFRDKALQVVSRDMSVNNVLNRRAAKVNEVSRPRIGRLTMYRYDAKHKDTLPYWDAFPMIFPIEIYPKERSFLGLNMHYLPPVFRARLMDALYDTLSNQRYNETTKLNINYQLLKNASKYKYFKPCIKKYLMSHVRSSFIEITPEEWDYAMFLPLARFQKMSQRKVWDESVRKIMSK